MVENKINKDSDGVLITENYLSEFSFLNGLPHDIILLSF